MMNLALVTWIVILIIAMTYFLLISLFVWGYQRLPGRHGKSALIGEVKNYNSISIIIAARNEEQNILKCLESIAIQDYPKDLFELIVVNDQSIDKTGKLVDHFIESASIKAIQLFSSGKGGKKEALQIGILASKGNKVITTDADCVVPPSWISEMNQCFQSTGAVFITGPVMMKPINGFFNKFQCLEFNSLIAATAGSIGLGMPVMCNGANMGFSLDAYHELSSRKDHSREHDSIIANQANQSGELSVNKQSDTNTIDLKPKDIMNHSIASGDDVFLMLAMKKYYGNKRIAFVDSHEAIVFTDTHQSVKAFISQRLRWVSKSGGYRDWQIIFTAVSIFSFNLVLLFLSIALILQPISILPGPLGIEYFLPVVTCGLYLLKTMVDTLLISPYLKKYGQYNLIRYLPIMVPLVVLYTVGIGFTGNFTSFSWKGRKITGTKT